MTHTQNPHVQFNYSTLATSYSKFSVGSSFMAMLDRRCADDDALHAMIAKAGDVQALLAIYDQCKDDLLTRIPCNEAFGIWTAIEAAGMAAAWDAIKDDIEQQSRLDYLESAFYDNLCLNFYP